VGRVPERNLSLESIMAVATPEWLAGRDGRLLASKDRRSWTVYLGGEPQYLLVPLPASGKFSCRVAQTINGRRLDREGTYPSAEDAVRGGLEDLRQALGW
jgi:hypothetical protein